MESAFNHGLSERDIQRALDAPISDEDPGLSVRGLTASSGLPIHVLGEHDPVKGDLVVYHAQRL